MLLFDILVNITTYCADDSGLIEFSEMKHLVLGLTVALQIRKGVDLVVGQQNAFSEDATWDLEEFASWFLTSFHFCDDRATGGDLKILGVIGEVENVGVVVC